ncbi:hypothetical protein A3F37_01105 [Candidatus Saccharibacteria bacterium RIFCSPHIGHO2_12_FULL_41_12]|nr:MAG: hypothetical protein A3F37_01105 [Candidatus Saccharibacteria bacterium RIFCSPHIGHO2_12_FULL_41_12]
MTAVLAYIFFFVAATVSPLQRRHQSRRTKTDPIVLAAWTQAFVWVLGLSLLYKADISFSWSWHLIFLNAGLFICGPLFFYLSYNSQKHVDATQSVVLSNIYTPVAIILAILFLSETLTLQQIMGAIILFIAMLIISIERATSQSFRFSKYSIYMLSSGVFLGIILFLEKATMNLIGNRVGIVVSWTAQTIGLLILAYALRGIHKLPTKREIFTSGALRYAQQLSYVTLLIVVGNLALVAAVTTFKIVFIFLGAFVFLHEKEHLYRKFFGVVIAIVGLLLMK